ncbi:hypothetical protein MMC13_007964 [Lambiella insularis]|nr:hypothetical protein [Lambiella insularis]
MTLKSLLKRKDNIQLDNPSSASALPPSEFTFMRTDTNTQEILEPPSPPPEEPRSNVRGSPSNGKYSSRFRSSFSASTASSEPKVDRRLSSLLHLRSHSRSSSINVPIDLPYIVDGNTEGTDEQEAEWEKRATILAKENPNVRHEALLTEQPRNTMTGSTLVGIVSGDRRPIPKRSISDAQGDDHIQEAIRLHEAGNLTDSTKMFGRLADPNGENNALSQVLYGLALRHGWGVLPDPSLAITYLSQAAANCASIEAQALSSGMKRGGAAKGELVLAIYELANCFRHGWGVDKDPVAARNYYETAANLGDIDAMNEAARCYEEGFGGKKDKVCGPMRRFERCISHRHFRQRALLELRIKSQQDLYPPYIGHQRVRETLSNRTTLLSSKPLSCTGWLKRKETKR